LDYAIEVVVFFAQMHRVSASSNFFTFAMVVELCAQANAICEEKIHCMVAKHDFKLKTFVGTTLIPMYSVRGDLSARKEHLHLNRVHCCSCGML